MAAATSDARSCPATHNTRNRLQLFPAASWLRCRRRSWAGRAAPGEIEPKAHGHRQRVTEPVVLRAERRIRGVRAINRPRDFSAERHAPPRRRHHREASEPASPIAARTFVLDVVAAARSIAESMRPGVVLAVFDPGSDKRHAARAER